LPNKSVRSITYSDANSYGYSYGNRHGNWHGDRNSHTDTDGDANPDTAMRRKMQSYTAGSSDSSASSVGLVVASLCEAQT
jgi:hypothetical protein